MPNYVPPPEIEYNADIPHGNYQDTLISSTILGNTRKIGIYTPPDYVGKDNFPVMLIHDGILFYSYGRINNVLDNLIAENRIQPIIAVFVPPVNREDEYAFDLTSQFETFIIEELMPIIDSKYRTSQDPKRRAMAGVSYGGLIASQICYNRPNDFGLCAAYSPAYGPKNMEVFRSITNGQTKAIKFYIDWGTYEYGIMQLASVMRENLISMGYDVVWNEWHEGHNYGSWRAHLDNSLEYFFPGGLGDTEDKETNTFSLRNYPNPFSHFTTLSYELQQPEKVSLSIYNHLGQLIYQTAENQQQGKQQLKWYAEGYADGIYYYRLNVGDAVANGKMVKVR
jgi:enterochelin esterase family protein